MSPEEMNRLMAAGKNKSDQIRILSRAGASKADIARHMGIRYQQVYNALLRENKVSAPDSNPGVSSGMVCLLDLDDHGTITLPRNLLSAAGFEGGEHLVCCVEDDGIKLMSRSRAVDYLRDIARQRLPDQAALFDALLGRKPETSASG